LRLSFTEKCAFQCFFLKSVFSGVRPTGEPVLGLFKALASNMPLGLNYAARPPLMPLGLWFLDVFLRFRFWSPFFSDSGLPLQILVSFFQILDVFSQFSRLFSTFLSLPVPGSRFSDSSRAGVPTWVYTCPVHLPVHLQACSPVRPVPPRVTPLDMDDVYI